MTSILVHNVVGLGAASNSGVGCKELVDRYFNLMVYYLVEHDYFARGLTVL